MAAVQQAATWAAQGFTVRRSSWSLNLADDNYRKSLRMYSPDRRLMSVSRGGANWYDTSMTVEDLLGDDWVQVNVD